MTGRPKDVVFYVLINYGQKTGILLGLGLGIGILGYSSYRVYKSVQHNNIFSHLYKPIQLGLFLSSAAALYTLALQKIGLCSNQLSAHHLFYGFLSIAIIASLIEKANALQPTATSEPTAAPTLPYIGGFPKEIDALCDAIKDKKTMAAWREYNIPLQKGILLYGPTGTGKTSLVKKMADQCNIPLISCTMKELLQGNQSYHQAIIQLIQRFKIAQKQADVNANKVSIIFIDEIDSFCTKRYQEQHNIAVSNHHNTLINTLLNLIDELPRDSDQGKVIVFGATNRPQELDQAIIRPGRFDTKIEIPPPDDAKIKAILNHYLNAHKLPPDEDEVDNKVYNAIIEACKGRIPASLDGLITAELRFLIQQKTTIRRSIVLENICKKLIDAQNR